MNGQSPHHGEGSRFCGYFLCTPGPAWTLSSRSCACFLAAGGLIWTLSVLWELGSEKGFCCTHFAHLLRGDCGNWDPRPRCTSKLCPWNTMTRKDKGRSQRPRTLESGKTTLPLFPSLQGLTFQLQRDADKGLGALAPGPIKKNPLMKKLTEHP